MDWMTMNLPILAILLLACGDQEVKLEETGDDGASYVVEVWADGQTASVDLFDQETPDFEGVPSVPVTAVLTASGLDVAWEGRTYDFEAYDGFRPSQKDGCDPLGYTQIQGAYLNQGSGNLVWEASLGLYGCYWVDGTTGIDVLDAAR